MDNAKYLHNLIEKVLMLTDVYYPLIEKEEYPLETMICDSTEDIHLPSEVKGTYRKISQGDNWGDNYAYAWFKANLKIDEKLQGKKIYLKANDGALENLIFINNKIIGIFDYIYPGGFNNQRIHKYCLISNNAKLGDTYQFDLEGYASHVYPGTQPFENPETYGLIQTVEEIKTFGGISVVVKDEEIENFVYNLQIAKELFWEQPTDAFVRGKIEKACVKIFEVISRKPLEDPHYRDGVIKANQILNSVLFSNEEKKPSPTVYLEGHSHMDTCWLWPEVETTKKLARTLANAVTLLKRYKEYTFICSSTYHLKLMEKYYPELFKDIQKFVAEGRFEPNGGSYIECDCNLTENEPLVRQFIVGQKYLKEKFNYHADAFYLPDTFGYSASLPQILKKFNMPYFLTTKMAWNDSNTFPYDTFKWEGIDGSDVLVHFNRIHVFPTALAINRKAYDIQNKHVNDIALITYGYGDGGGGPSEEMVQGALKSKHTIGVVNSEHTTVSKFMDKLSKYDDIPMYHGELYLELHRGTLTSQSKIKKNNRKVSIDFNNYETLEVLSKTKHNAYEDELYEDYLVNQFHDILPGTCLEQGVDYALERFERVSNGLKDCYDKLIGIKEETVYNLNKVDYQGSAIFDSKVGNGSSYISCHGNTKYVLNDVNAKALAVAKLGNSEHSLISFNNNVLKTPYYKVKFNKDNEITSLIDLTVGRELVKEKGMFNKIVIAEDVPLRWDNWDIDYDLPLKEKKVACIDSKIVLNDGSTFIMQNTYQVSEKSTLKMDIIFYHNSERIDFDCELDYHDSHRVIKALFDTTMVTDIVRNEIQYGYINRPNYLNDVITQAKFEICNHKYSTLVEPTYCFSLLNDCKYGLSCRNSTMGLTLIKSGTHPDERADNGIHTFKYAIYPKALPFGKEAVIDEAYRFNNELKVMDKKMDLMPFEFKSNGVVVEVVKHAMNNDNDLVIRCYEAVGTQGSLTLDYPDVYEVDFMEENPKKMKKNIVFKPFEIKTLYIKL